MKLYIRSILLFSLLFALTSNSMIASNNDDDENQWAIGIQGGLNISNKHNDNKWGSKTGFQAGVFIDYTLYEFLFVRSGLKYTTKGANYTSTQNSSSIVNTNELNLTKEKVNINRQVGYLHAPLSLGVSIQVTDNFVFNIIAGAYLEYGIAFKSTTTTKQQLINRETGVREETSDKRSSTNQSDTFLKKGDFGASFAMEGEYKQFVIGMEYERGFRNVRIKSANNPLFNKWQNKNASFYVGYKFKL